MNWLVSFLFFMWLCVGIALGIILACIAVTDHMTCGGYIVDMIRDLFTNRNLFGYLMSGIVVILLIPSILILLLAPIIIWIYKLFGEIWQFGYRKE